MRQLFDRSVTAAPNRSALSTFVGREDERAALGSLLVDPSVRLVTLTGPGGVGKTRLATAVAHEVQPRFADGVAMVDLTPIVDGRLVFGEIVRSLGAEEKVGESPRDTLARLLCDQQCLLVLDNFEQVVTAGPDVVELLEQCPGLTCLTTSRTFLRVTGEHEFRVRPLAVPAPGSAFDLDALRRVESVNLFVQRAQAANAEFQLVPENTSVVAAICTSLDGLPLALELAASRIRVLPIEAIRRRLTDRLGLLSRGPRDRPLRQQTMRAAIGWSYDLLAPPEQALFRRLAVFAGAWTVEAASAVAAPDAAEDDVLDGLASLVEHSMIVPYRGGDDEPRYSMLATIREYGLEQLRASGDWPPTEQGYQAFYLDLAERARAGLLGNDAPVWLARVEAELDDLRAVVRHAIDAGGVPTALRLGRTLALYWSVQGFFREGREQIDQILGLPYDGEPNLDWADLWLKQGNLSHFQSDYSHARACFATSRAMFERLGERRGIAVAANGLGNVAHRLNDLDAAEAHYGESYRIYCELGRDADAAYPLENLGSMAFERGDLEVATARYTEALEIQRRVGNRRQIASLLNNLGNVADQRRDYEAARQHYQESLDINRAIDDPLGRAYATGNLALNALRRRDLSLAQALYADGLEQWVELENRWGMAIILEGLGGTLVGSGLPDLAARLFGAAAALRIAYGCPLAPSERSDLEPWFAEAKALLGPGPFEAASRAGQRLSLNEAVAEARAAASRPLPPTPPVVTGRAKQGDLTRREREVARLVADGLTDREIAERLVIAEGTVGIHLDHIYTKLGIRTRAQLASWLSARAREEASPSERTGSEGGAPPTTRSTSRRPTK